MLFADFKFFRCQVCNLSIIHGFLNVAGLVGPGETYSKFDLSCGVDEDVMWANIADFFIDEGEILCCGD